MKKICGNCEYTDGLIYTSCPPMVRCMITGKYHFQNYKCDVEFAPIKRGRWKWTGVGVLCSSCNYKLQTTGIPSYCPNCGAKMENKE